jgi:hypothetical protein
MEPSPHGTASESSKSIPVVPSCETYLNGLVVQVFIIADEGTKSFLVHKDLLKSRFFEEKFDVSFSW